ncbi:MAG: HisA/HisF-related TIM barrel protein [Lawsonibacter sp.]
MFYDITASHEGRKLFTDILTKVASAIFIPLTVGAASRGLDDFERVLACGADKVSVNSGAVQNSGAHRGGGQAVRRPVRGAVGGREAGGRAVTMYS